MFSNDAETVDLFSQDYCGAYSYKIEGFPQEDLLIADQLPESPLTFTAPLTLTLETIEDFDLIGEHEITLTVWQEDFPEIAPVAVKFNLIVDLCILETFEVIYTGETTLNYLLGSAETLTTSPITFVQTPACEDVVRLLYVSEVDWLTPNEDLTFSIMTED